MKSLLVFSLLAAEAAYAFPFVAEMPGVDSSMLPTKHRRQQNPEGPGSAAQCPFNPNHVPAPLVTAQYPYNNARRGRRGDGRGGFRVPAQGDTVHRFIAPTSRDIRGPCPGLNTAANHGFLARDGITTFAELVDAQQNVYNVGYDLSLLLAFLGLQADGDLITTKLSIGCEATSRTSINPLLTGSQPGLAGHNKFEGDTSLTRNDFFTHNGDNFSFNRTLFDMMTETTGGIYDLQGLALYRRERWDQSVAENPNFYFGPLSLLLFGAASFLYELFPSGTKNYVPDYDTIASFFIDERLPDNWTNRKTPYSNRDVTQQILAMYLLHPVPFGGSIGDGTFAPINWGQLIRNGTISTDVQPAAVSCLLYQLATQSVPSTLNGIVTPTVEALSFFARMIQPEFDNLGCPRPLTK